MTPGEFITKWLASQLKESAASQEHFIDLCRLLGVRNRGREDQPIHATPLLVQPFQFATARSVNSADGPEVPRQQLALRRWSGFQVV